MKNILEISNGLGIGGTEKTMQIFCKFFNKKKFNVFACGVFQGGMREALIKPFVSDLLVAHGDIDKIKTFVIKNNIEIVHWHSITQSPGEYFDKTVLLLNFFKEQNIKVIETSPFSIYNEIIDDLLDIKLFVSKTNLIKYFWKFGNKLKNKTKYSYLYNPLDIDDLEKYRLNQNEKNELRRKYGICESDFVIGKVGRANLWKWDDTIIDIVPNLIKEIKDLKIVIRAIPEIKKKKIQKMGLEKYFIYLPESVNEKDITETYQLMDIMVHTSRIGECNSVAINEGLFFGLPIITKPTDFLEKTIFDRDNGQIEIIKNNLNGFTSNKNKEIAEIIIELYLNKNRRIDISKNNIKKSLDILNAKNITLTLEEILEENNLPPFNYQHDISEYKKRSLKSNFLDLLKINITAIYDKFINNA